MSRILCLVLRKPLNNFVSFFFLYFHAAPTFLRFLTTLRKPICDRETNEIHCQTFFFFSLDTAGTSAVFFKPLSPSGSPLLNLFCFVLYFCVVRIFFFFSAFPLSPRRRGGCCQTTISGVPSLPIVAEHNNRLLASYFLSPQPPTTSETSYVFVLPRRRA